MIKKEEWQIKKLGEVCEILDNLRRPVTKKDRLKGIYPYYGATGIQDYVDNFIFDGSFVLVGEDGARWGANDNCAFIVKGKCWVNNHAHVLKINKNILEKWVVYFLNFKDLNEYISGAVIRKLNQAALRGIPIPIPSLPIQQQIVFELDALSDIITKKKQQLEELDKLAQATFYDMFGDPVSNEKGWGFKTIEQLVIKDRHAIKRGPFGGALKKEIFVESGYLVYEQFHALNNDFSFARYFIDENDFQRLKTFEVHSGDIIISCSGVYLGKLAIIPENSKKGIINQALLKISLDNNIIDSRFFVFVFSNENFKSTYYGNTIGSGIPNFPPMSDFKKFKFICPPFQLQLQFNKRIESIEKQKELINKSIDDVQQLFDYTMDKYFN